MTGERKNACRRPPLGWRCSRKSGHDGPCAAHYEFTPQATHIKCDSYTDYVQHFGIYKEQLETCRAWIADHDAAKHTTKYGVMPVAYTWSFTETALGTRITLKCSCGEEIDVSDYDQW